MIATPEITESKQQPAAVIHMDVLRTEIRTVMSPLIHEVLAALSSQGLAPAGALFMHHLTTSATRFDFEAGFPVKAPVQAVGRVKAGELPGARIARTIYMGPYEGLFQAWSEFNQWMKQEGHTGRGDLWENYLVGPESGPDSAAWRTELCLPLKP